MKIEFSPTRPAGLRLIAHIVDKGKHPDGLERALAEGASAARFEGRAGQLFDQSGVPIVGLIENMAGYVCPHCGEMSDPFGAGGVEAAAERLELPFLGRVPLALAIRESGDAGKPPAASDDAAVAEPFHAIARKVQEWLAANA